MNRRSVLLGVVSALAAVTVTALASASPQVVRATGTGTAVNNEYLPKGVTPCTTNWLMWGCDSTGDGYSQLKQITESNVANLKVAWNEGFDGNVYNQAVESQPICCANGMMYTTTAFGFTAVNPGSGAVKWAYQGPTNEGPVFGLTSVTKEARSEAYDPVTNYVYTGQQDGSVVALNATTGQVVWTVDVAGTGTYGSATHSETAPFTVYCGYAQCGPDGLIITAPNGGESPIRGHLDAFNAKTGALVWRTWMTPDPTQLPFILSWSNPAEASVGGATVWSLPSVDPATGSIYYNTGNPYPYLGRQPGDDLWSDSTLSLKMSTGAMRWFYQDIRHDEWDYDCPNPTVEYNAMVGGKLTPIISAACKSAYVYLFSPQNGHPIYPIPQVAMSTQPGYTAAGAALNETAATQPEPTGGEGSMIDHCPSAANAAIQLPGDYPTGPDGTPAVLSCNYVAANASNWIVKPYYISNGIDYPRPTYDPLTNDQYFCATQSIMIEKNQGATTQNTTIINSGRVSLLGIAAKVSALDIGNNTLAWQRVLMANQDGNCYSGTMSTASGLLFYASKGRTDGTNTTFRSNGTNPGGYLYAVDAATGKIVWTFQNPFGDLIEAPPITYMYGGKQYLAEYFECPLTTNGSFNACSSHDQLMVFSL